MRWAAAVILLVLVAAAGGQAPTANPAIFDSSLLVSPSPPVVEQDTSIDVTVHNNGNAYAGGVEVQLSWNDFGLMFSGWQPIGAQETAVSAGAESSVSFKYTFESRAHVAIQAKILEIGSGGDAIASDNIGLFNTHIVHTGDKFSYHVPIANPGDLDAERSVTVAIDVRCDNGTWLGDCPFDVTLEVPGMGADGLLVLEAEDDTLASISANLTGVENGEYHVVLRGVDQDSGAETHVKLVVVKTTVSDLMDAPSFCCLGSVRARSTLEKVLLLSQRAYVRGDPKLAMQRLRLVIQNALNEECHRGVGEVGCLEEFMLKLVDAARMMAVEYGETDAHSSGKLKDGDWFRMMGLYEAAVVEYNNYFSWSPEYGLALAHRAKQGSDARRPPHHPSRSVEL